MRHFRCQQIDWSQLCGLVEEPEDSINSGEAFLYSWFFESRADRDDASEEERAAYKMWQNDSMTVKYIMLASISNEHQRQHEEMEPQSILLNLKELYGEQSRAARYEISK